MKKTLLIISFVSLLLYSCRDKCSEGERGNPYIDMVMKVTPAADSIRLGDTLTVSIEIPFENVNTRDGSRMDISRSSISEFGLGYALFVKTSDTTRITYGVDQFKIIYEKGGGRNYLDARNQNWFEKNATGFVFRAKVIPLRKGLMNLVNARAEGEQNKGCILIDYKPSCMDAIRYHQVYFNYFGVPYNPNFTATYPNHYYVWVK